MTGRPPFKAATTLDTVLQVLHTDPVPPRRFQPTVPRDLETICLKCLHKEPPRRYTHAQELSEDLRRFLAGEPIRARPVAWWERAKKWAHRRPASAALIGVCALAMLGLLLGGLWHHNRLAEALEREQNERDRADRVVQEALDTMSRLVRVDSDIAGGAQPQAFPRKLLPPKPSSWRSMLLGKCFLILPAFIPSAAVTFGVKRRSPPLIEKDSPRITRSRRFNCSARRRRQDYSSLQPIWSTSARTSSWRRSDPVLTFRICCGKWKTELREAIRVAQEATRPVGERLFDLSRRLT